MTERFAMNATFSMRTAVGVLAATTAATQLINVLLVFAQGRLYTPVAVGLLANVLSVATILSPLATMQMSYALPQQRSMREVAEIAGLVVISAFATLSLLGTGGALYIVFARPAAVTIEIGMLGLCLVPFLVLYDLARMLAARDGAFRSIGTQNLSLAGLRALIQIAGAFFGASQYWLVAGEAFGRLGSLSATQASTRHAVRVLRSEKLDFWGSLRAHWRFPLISLPSTFLDNMGSYLPAILMGHLFGLGAAGLYFLAQRVVNFPILLLVQSTADVIQVRAAQIMHADKTKLLGFVLRASGAFLAIGVAAAATLFVFVQFLWSWMLGARWAAAQQMALMLLLPGILQTVCGPMSRMLIVTNRQALKLVFDFIYLGAALSPLGAKWFGYHEDATDAVWSLSVGYLVAYVAYFAIILLAASRPIDLKRLGP